MRDNQPVLRPPTLHDALLPAQESLTAAGLSLSTARMDAEHLLLHTTGLTRAALLTHPEATLTPAQHSAYQAAITRRAQSEPIQYITGEQEFYGRPFRVTPAVLIPRPETEHIIEAALALPKAYSQLHIADVGTGSGILAITLALEIGLQATVTATDISPAALDLARENAARLGALSRIRFLEADLLAGLAAHASDNAPYHLIVSNPPYVAETEVLEPQVARYEPHSALFAGPDGLAIYRRLIPQAARALAPGGHLLLEIGHGQQDAVAALLAASGFQTIRVLPDLQGIPRVASAQKQIRK